MGNTSELLKPSRRAAYIMLNRFAEGLWHIPGKFRIASVLGPRYALRCVLFHDVSDSESPFTHGLSVTASVRQFEASLQYLKRHYTPVRLHDVLADPRGRNLPPRPVLVTFDDAYASVAKTAAPLCAEYCVPAVFFVNAACLDNKRLALDNLICYFANMEGLAALGEIVEVVAGGLVDRVDSLARFFGEILPAILLDGRRALHDAILERIGISERDLAISAGLYITSHELQKMAAANFEIGNHTYTHVHGRLLSGSAFEAEIDRNKAELEKVSGCKVRSFSVPYGCGLDLTEDLARHLSWTGHEAVFLSGSVANCRGRIASRYDRVSSKANTDAALFAEIEVLPRLRAVRDAVKERNRAH